MPSKAPSPPAPTRPPLTGGALLSCLLVVIPTGFKTQLTPYPSTYLGLLVPLDALGDQKHLLFYVFSSHLRGGE